MIYEVLPQLCLLWAFVIMLFSGTIIHNLHGFILLSTNLTSLTFFFAFKNLLRVNFFKILRLFNVMVAQNLLACDLNITYLLVVLSSVFLVLTHQRKMEKLSISIATSPRPHPNFSFSHSTHLVGRSLLPNHLHHQPPPNTSALECFSLCSHVW
jgi:hypothetical protein